MKLQTLRENVSDETNIMSHTELLQGTKHHESELG